MIKPTGLGPLAGEWQSQEANPGLLAPVCLSRVLCWVGLALLAQPHSLLSVFQAQQFHHHRAPASGTRDKDGFPGPPRYRSAVDGVQSSTRNAGPAVAGPHRWQAKGGQVPHLLPDPGSPRLARNARPLADGKATEEHSSPFGIPYSKLSQSKHLKARTGGSQWASSDSKRRAQAPRDRKDP